MKDIETNDDIKLLVDSFYSSARADELLGPIFDNFIENWDAHHIKLYQFWRTVILKQAAYQAKPAQMHLKMELTKKHFNQWIVLWNTTVDHLFSGENAENAKFRGQKMSDALLGFIQKNK